MTFAISGSRKMIWSAFVFIAIINDQFHQMKADENESRLYESLLTDYDPLERPAANNSHPIVVTLDVILQQIVGLDEKNQILESNVWLKYEWKDYKMKWIPEFYGNITDVRFPHNMLWKPDVLLYNSADSSFDSTYPTNLVVYSDGTVNWIPPGILKSSCKIDITWFPFDDQNCYLKFGSWTYHGFALDLRPAYKTGVTTTEFITNGEWLILESPVKQNKQYYECCPEPYLDLKFFLKIRRRTLYYGFNLIIPSLLMAFVTILGFFLPPDACEKITLEITILLSFCFFLGIVANMTPATSEAVPLIGVFFTCCTVLVSVSVVSAVFAQNLHFREADTHEITPLLRALLLNWLPWLLLMRRPGYKFTRKSVAAAFKNAKEDDQMSESLLRNVALMEKALEHNEKPGPIAELLKHRKESLDLDSRINKCLTPYINQPGIVDPGVRGMLLQLQTIHLELRFMTQRMERDDEDDEARSDWKFAAMVVDRLCLVIFSVFLVTSSCGIMFSAPNLFAA